MINWFKRKQGETANSELPAKTSVLSRLMQGLSKTRLQLGRRICEIFLNRQGLDAELLAELETILLMADFGVDTTQFVLDSLQKQVAQIGALDGDAILALLKQQLIALLDAPRLNCSKSPLETKPWVLLMVGVNGAGKTTTIGKLAQLFQAQGQRVLLAAGDTFRSAAVEQLQAWGEKNEVAVIAQHTGADSASVLFDALNAAKARGIDVLIADTAGRLHTQHHLMDELKKVQRVLQKIDATAPHEVLLVLDASIGQNALNQARVFHEALGVTGIVLTKLDGTAKGGIVFAIAHTLGIPLCYVGVGEGVDDLREFDATQFVEAIFEDDRI